MTSNIEPAKLLELCEAFDLFDDDGEGVIPLNSVPRLLKSLGLVIPEATLANMLYHFAQTQVLDANKIQSEVVNDIIPKRRKIAKKPNDDFGSCMSTAEPNSGPILDRDENGLTHPKLTGKIKVEKIKISLKELLDLLGTRGSKSEPQIEEEEASGRGKSLRDALQLFDVQKNGTVTVSDLRKALRISVGNKDSLSDADIDKIIDSADPDKSGLVNYEELSDQLFC
jgi:Ca2+-binding EF-hand superfamily protein